MSRLRRRFRCSRGRHRWATRDIGHSYYRSRDDCQDCKRCRLYNPYDRLRAAP